MRLGGAGRRGRRRRLLGLLRPPRALLSAKAAAKERMPSYRALGLHLYEAPPARQLLGEGALALGLDVNRGSTGFAVLDARGTLLEAGAVATRGGDDTLQIVEELQEAMRGVAARHEGRPWVVGVEAYLKTFGLGRFNTRGLFALAELNASVAFMASQVFGCRPHRVHPTVPRKMYGLTKAAARDRDGIKAAVLRAVWERYPDHYPAPGEAPAPSKSKDGDAVYDAADACLVGLAALKLECDRAILGSDEEAERFAALLRVREGRKPPGRAMMRRLFERVLEGREPP